MFTSIDSNDSLVKTTINKREVVYFLVSEDDINSLKSKAILADVFMLLASLAWGAFLSVCIARSIAIQPQDQILSMYVILLWAFGIAGFVFSSLAVIYLILSNGAIKRFKGSVKVEEKSDKSANDQPQSVQTSPKSNLHVVHAIYYTQKKSVDVTAKLNQFIKNNQLMITVSNDLVDGDDPDYGIQKMLRVKYEFGGLEFTKESKERETLSLP